MAFDVSAKPVESEPEGLDCKGLVVVVVYSAPSEQLVIGSAGPRDLVLESASATRVADVAGFVACLP